MGIVSSCWQVHSFGILVVVVVADASCKGSKERWEKHGEVTHKLDEEFSFHLQEAKRWECLAIKARRSNLSVGHE